MQNLLFYIFAARMHYIHAVALPIFIQRILVFVLTFGIQ